MKFYSYVKDNEVMIYATRWKKPWKYYAKRNKTSPGYILHDCIHNEISTIGKIKEKVD